MKITFLLGAALAVCVACSSSGSSDDSNNGTPTPTDVVTPQNVADYLVDPNATTETAALFYNLRLLSKTRFAVGQHDAFYTYFQDNAAQSDMKKATGSDPAMLGSDFMFITDKNNDGTSGNWYHQQEQSIKDDIRAAYAQGMINTLCWHLREPNQETSFYANDMPEADRATAFRSILPGGSHHEWFKSKLDKVAEVLSSLKDSNGKPIPIIFRPFHEFDGNWFWWGAAYCTAEEYKTIFRFTVTYLRDTKNVHNVLYAFSPDNSYTNETGYLSRYPGDDYVDILGMDNYGDFNNQGLTGSGRANAKLQYLTQLAESRVKVAALTETGYRVTASVPPVTGWFTDFLYPALTDNNVRIAYVMFWSNNQDGYYVPPSGQSNTADFVTFTNKSRSILASELPSMYTFP